MSQDKRQYLQAIREKALRESRNSFEAFYRLQGYEPSIHHKILIDKLERLESGEFDRLMIFLPPGSAKSSITSILFAAWYMGRSPTKNIVAASHTGELAARFGRKVRNLVGTDEFNETFDVTVSKDSSAADRWETSRGGEYFAVGVGGSVTGRRADCLPGHTLVLTRDGLKRIDDVYLASSTCEVMSYDESTHRPRFNRVLAVARREAEGYWRIRTASGRVVEATGNHRIYVNGAFYPAQTVNVGDVLMSDMRDIWGTTLLRTGEEDSERSRVHPGMFAELRDTAEQQPTRNADVPQVQELWKGDASRRATTGLFRRVSSGALEEGRPKKEIGTFSILRNLWERIQAAIECCSFTDVFYGMQKQIAFAGNEGAKQPQLAGWKNAKQVSRGQRPEVPMGEKDCLKARRELLRDVSIHREAAVAPHGYGQYEQCAGEHSDSVPGLPHETAWGRAEERPGDPVVLVEFVHQTGYVYDIEVEHDHNFFANGVLVHNCIIIDDPVRSREDADSQTIREKTWEWYVADLSTRLKPEGKVILIQTRWHEDDLGGRILERERDKWEVLSIPMECESLDDPLGRKIGERLWPEWFTEEMVAIAKSDERLWSSLYQQRPRPMEGAEFKRDWVQWYEQVPQRRNMSTVMLVDPAAGKQKTSDYTAIWVIGLGQDGNYYVVDMVRDRLNLTERAAAVFRLHKKWKPYETRYERYGMMGDIEHIKDKMERESYRFRIVEVGGALKKEDRIRRLVPLFQQGRVWFPTEFWYTETTGKHHDLIPIFIDEELLAFPVSKHDDLLDSLSRIAQPDLELRWPKQEEYTYRLDDFEPIYADMGY